MNRSAISIDYLRECFDYDPETGVLTWRIRPSSHFKSGRAEKNFNAQFAGKKAGHAIARGYLSVGVMGINTRVHRIAWALSNGRLPQKAIDHINGVTSDNRPCNLREAEAAENQWNSAGNITNTTGYRGVVACYGRWRAQINVRGKRIHLGVFDSPEAASKAYCTAAATMYGEFVHPETAESAREQLTLLGLLMEIAALKRETLMGAVPSELLDRIDAAIQAAPSEADLMRTLPVRYRSKPAIAASKGANHG